MLSAYIKNALKLKRNKLFFDNFTHVFRKRLFLTIEFKTNAVVNLLAKDPVKKQIMDHMKIKPMEQITTKKPNKVSGVGQKLHPTQNLLY